MTSGACWRCNFPRITRLLLVLGAAVALVEGAARTTSAADAPVEAIAKKIALQTETRKSVELRLRTTIASSKPVPKVKGSFDSMKSTTSKWPANGGAMSSTRPRGRLSVTRRTSGMGPRPRP